MPCRRLQRSRDHQPAEPFWKPSGNTNNNPMRRRQNTIQGFTLIELMVVMLLISIILAVAIPRFEGGWMQDPIKKVSRKMISTVRNVRSKTVQTQKQHALIVDFDAQQLYVIVETTDPEATPGSTTATGKFKLPESITLVDVQYPNSEPVSTGSASIRFYPAGYSDYALIRMENSSEERFTFVIQPLLPKVKLYQQWIEF
jgi:prepilin-type N-terminal cleavage/methylation domain-containing protein